MSEDADFGPITRIEDAILEVAVVRTAVELALFTAVHETSGAAADVARRAGVPERGVRVTLDALCAMGFLGKDADGRYVLTPMSRQYLVTTSPGYYGDTLLKTTLTPALIQELTPSVSAGVAPRHLTTREGTGALWAEDFAPSLLGWTEEAEAGREVWRAAGVDLGSLRDALVLDLGCGAAVRSLVTARAHESNRVHGVDLYPEVLDVARAVAERMGVAGRLDVTAGDLLDLDLGTARYDYAYSRAVLYFFAPDSVADVFLRVRAALRPGGALLLNHRMPDAARAGALEPLLLAVQLFLLHEHSHVATYPEYEVLLRRAGFDRVEQRRWDLLVAYA